MATRTRKLRRTPEQIAEQVDALREQQLAALKTLLDSDQWKRHLLASSLLRSYSLANTLLVLIQRPDATRVAGFNTWKALDRKVVSGKGTSIKIWGKPYHPAIWVDEASLRDDSVVLDRKEGKAKVKATFTRCPVLSVFDIAQTEGAPITPTETGNTLGQGDAAARANAQDAWDTVTTWLTDTGWTLLSANREGSSLNRARGWTCHADRTIYINPDLSLVDQARVLLHETAHVVLHGNNEWAQTDTYGQDQQHRGTAEVQAESASFALAGLFGIDTSEMATGYVAGWALPAAGTSEQDAVLAVAERAARAVHHVVRTVTTGIEADSGTVRPETAPTLTQNDMEVAA